jgi:hypothetical protein
MSKVKKLKKNDINTLVLKGDRNATKQHNSQKFPEMALRNVVELELKV